MSCILAPVMRVLLVIATLLILNITVNGQSNFATMAGVVTDPAKGSIYGAVVTIRHLDTNTKRRMVTAHSGDYTLTNLPPGQYELEIQAPGFRIHRATGIVLQVGQHVRQDCTLEIGAVVEAVTVTTAAPTVNTEVGAIKGDVIAHEEIQELPLDGRDFTDLAFFVPGVVQKAQGGQGSAMNINGARATNTNFYVDGFNNRNARGAAAQVRPNIDAMQEFKMETSGFSAEYGKMAGGILNMVLRSGSNRFHGSFFEYLRNDKFDSRGFFETTKNKLRRNQFGATLSGPVFKNKTFFLVSYEGYIQSIGLTRLGHTPTPAEREGDFSQSVDFAGKPINLKDPLASGACTATNRKACFAGNRIPASRIDPIGRRILGYYPLPNRTDIRNNYLVTATDEDRWNSVLVKIDHRLGDKDNMNFRWQTRFNDTMNPFAGGSELGIFGQSIDDNRTLAGVDWTHMFSPTLLMEFRTGFSRNSAFDTGQYQGRDVSAELGLPSLTADPELMDFPKITVRDHFQIGTGDNQPVQFHVTDIQYNQKLTWVKTKHTLKAGFDVSRVRFNQPYFNNIRGTYNFQGRWTNAPIGDLLLGLLNNSSRQVGFARNYYRSTSYGMFFNDDWKVTRSLTLNLGLRYEINRPPADRYDRIANFVPRLNQVVIASADTVPNLSTLLSETGLEGKVATREVAGLPRSLVNTDWNNLAPRIGFAWRAFGSNRTVIRGGYGIFYGGENLNPIRNNLSNNFPFSLRQNFNRLSSDPTLVTLQSPFPARRATFSGVTNAAGYEENAPTAYLQSWNLTFERELLRGTAVEIGYVGSKGTHLGRRYDYNQPFRSEELYAAGGGFPRPIAGFNAVNLFTFGSNSIYNAMHISVRKRAARGLFYRFNYSYSKSIDDASQLNGNSDGGFPNAQDSRNLRLDRARSDFDIGHLVSVVASYELPFARRAPSAWMRMIVSGWQLSGTMRASTGQPFTVRTSDVDLNLGESQRPNRVGSGKWTSAPRPGKRGVDYPWFNLADFEEVPCAPDASSSSCNVQSQHGFRPFAFGNSGRNILDGPGLLVANMGLRKNFRVGESHNLQLRLDAFNVLNRTNFLLPENMFNAITGGYITRVGDSGRSGGPRVFQAALSWRF